MAEFTERHETMLQETHDAAIKIKTVLLGENGVKGLCGEHEELKHDYYDFKRRCILVFGVLIGAGVLGGSGYAIFQAIIQSV